MGRISTEDLAFIRYVNRQINQNSALGIELPFESLYDVIVDAAMYFWEWDDDATQEEVIGLPSSEVQKYMQGGLSGTAKVPLPEWVGFITRLIPARVSWGNAYNDAFRISMLQNYQGYMGGIGGSYDIKVSDVIVNMFEVSMYNSVMYHGIRYDYNNTNHILNISGSKNYDITLVVERRLDFPALYNNRLFKKYVVGQAFINMSNIVGTFNFELPNGATINYDKLEALGDKRVESVESELAGRNNTSGRISI